MILSKRMVLPVILFIVFTLNIEANSKKMKLVAQDECGVRGKEPHLVEGSPYTFIAKGVNKSALSVTFGVEKVVYGYDGMDIQADYSLKLTFYSDAQRKLKLLSDTREIKVINLPRGKVITEEITLPKFAYAYGNMVLVFENMEGPNVVVSEIQLYSSNPKKLKPSKNVKKTVVFDYSKIAIPQPIYVPFPKSTNGVTHPIMTLSGKWKFNPSPSAGFPTKISEEWKAIQVPGHWTTQGFTVKDGTYAGYIKEFELPTDWRGKAFRIRFDSVFSDCIVYINGREVGRHLGTFTAFEFDVTKALQPGKNIIALKVRNDSMADNLGSLNQYANFPLGGILRKVTLFAVPEMHISDMRIDTRFDSKFEDAVLNLYFELTNNSQERYENANLIVTVPDAIKPYTIQIPSLEKGESSSITAAIPVKSPKQWDNEHPNLYTLECSLLNKGKITESISKRFGFRQVEIQGNRMVVNGKPIKLTGVCRHEAHPLLGRALTMEQWRKDVEIFMSGNVNFIRTSHYPPAEEFIAICDEQGIFVEVEAPICWVGHGANKSWGKNNYKSSEWYPYMLQANMETVRFHRNNPSIIFWSLANESFWSENWKQVLNRMIPEDKTRPFIFHDQDYGGFNNHNSDAPVANIHYPGPNGANAVKKYTRPILFGEYCHLNVYNRQELVTDPGIRNTWGNCLDRIWNKMYKTDACLGGSIWSGIDDLFLLPDGRAVGYGSWGPIDGWRRPKPEYFYMKKVYSPIRVLTKRLNPGPSAELIIANRHSFTNLKELTVKWQVGNRSGVATADIREHTTGKLPINTKLNDGEELKISFFSNKGYLIDTFNIPVGKNEAVPTAQSFPPESIKMELVGDEYILTSKVFTCKINKTTGAINSVVKDGKIVISGGVNLLLNSLKSGGCKPDHSADTPAWDPLCTKWKASRVEAIASNESVNITVKGVYAEAKGQFTYTIQGNGIITINYDFKTLRKLKPRQVGLMVNLPDRFNKVRWERQSTFSGFPKEHIGRLKGRAPAFYGEKPNYPVDKKGHVKRTFIRQQPQHPWSNDCNELGSADFRGSRNNILYYEMSADNGDKVTILSDGKQTGRCRIDGDKIRLYGIDIDTGGAEIFLNSHLKYLRKSLKKGDSIKGKMTLRIE